VHHLLNANPGAAGGAWVDSNLTTSATEDPSGNSVPNAAQASSLSSFSDEYGEHAVYVGSDQHVHQLVHSLDWPDSQWVDQDLTLLATPFIESAVPSAAQLSALSSFVNPNTTSSNVEWIFYVGNDQHVHLLTFAPPPQFKPQVTPLTTPTCPVPNVGYVGQAYSGTVSVSGGTPPYSWSLQPSPPGSPPLPLGLTISSSGPNTNSAQITWQTPSATGSSGLQFLVIVTDNNGSSAQSGGCVIYVYQPLLSLNCPTSNAVTNQLYSSTVTETGGEPPYTFTPVSIPSWLMFSSTMTSYTLSGTPTVAEPYEVTIKVQDANGNTQIAQCTITVTPTFQVTAQQFYQSQTGETGGGWPKSHKPIFSWFLNGPASGLTFVTTSDGTPVASVESPPGTYTISGVMNGAQLSLNPSWWGAPLGWQLCTATPGPTPSPIPTSFFTVTTGTVTQIFIEPPAIVSD
jgi:hypothetical protein